MTVFVYDAADRHVKTITPNGTGTAATVAYTRDATGPIISHQTSGSGTASENGTVRCGFTAGGDTPDIYLGSGGVIGSRVLGLDGELLRHGGMGKVFVNAYAPSTLGSFLRSFHLQTRPPARCGGLPVPDGVGRSGTAGISGYIFEYKFGPRIVAGVASRSYT